MKNILRGAWKWIGDSLFPLFCIGCKKEGQFLCEECLAHELFDSVEHCPVCSVVVSDGFVCSDCVDNSYLDAHLALGVYKEGTLSAKLIELLKYKFIEDAVNYFDEPMHTLYLTHKDYFDDIDYVVSIPLHKRRYAERGFNQAKLTADLVGKVIDKPVRNDLVKRVLYTKQQALLSREKRLENIKSAFLILNVDDIKGRRILLVDDVFTTGATMQTCAEVLLSAGCRDVRGFSLLRG